MHSFARVALLALLALLGCALVFAQEDGGVFDDEEFVGLDAFKAEETVEHQGERVPEKKVAPDPVASFSMLPKDFTLEIIYGTVIVVYIAAYIVGRSKNMGISARVFDAAVPVLREHFHLVTESPSAESLHEYHVLATGRAHCDGAKATLELLRRQDLFSLGWSAFVAKQEDIFTLDVVLPEDIPPVVLAVVHEMQRKTFVKDYPDIAFAKGMTGSKVEMPLNVLCDSDDAMRMLLTNEVVAVLNRLKHNIRVIHITDSNKRMNHKQMLRMRFTLPSDNLDIAVLLNMSMYFVDLVSRLQLTKSSLERARKVRAAMAEKEWKAQSAQRQELAQQRKAEKLQKKKEELEKLPQEVQEKILEKKMRKAQKQRGPKMKVMHG